MNHANFDIDSLHGDEPYLDDEEATAESIQETNEKRREHRDERSDYHATTR